MSKDNLIDVEQICSSYGIENAFVVSLNEHGLVNLVKIEEQLYIPGDCLGDFEKIMRMHFDLGINLEGIEVALNLLERMNEMERELRNLKLRIAEH